MSILFAILLGILQGVFEFLPVSSSALTALSGNLMVVDGVPAVGVSALLHTGSLIAAAVMLRSSWRKLFHACGRILRDLAVNIRTSYRNVRFGENGSPVRILGNTEKTLAAMIAAVSLPALIIGFLLRQIAFREPVSQLLCGMGFFLTAILLLVAGLLPKESMSGRDLSLRKCLLLGILQGFAVLPGLSRLGVVYAGAQLLGMHRKNSARFAVLSAIPMMAASVIYEWAVGLRSVPLDGETIACICIGVLVSGLFTGLVIKGEIKILRRRCLRLFSTVNVLLGLAAVVLYVTGS